MRIIGGVYNMKLIFNRYKCLLFNIDDFASKAIGVKFIKTRYDRTIYYSLVTDLWGYYCEVGVKFEGNL